MSGDTKHPNPPTDGPSKYISLAQQCAMLAFHFRTSGTVRDVVDSASARLGIDASLPLYVRAARAYDAVYATRAPAAQPGTDRRQTATSIYASWQCDQPPPLHRKQVSTSLPECDLTPTNRLLLYKRPNGAKIVTRTDSFERELHAIRCDAVVDRAPSTRRLVSSKSVASVLRSSPSTSPPTSPLQSWSVRPRSELQDIVVCV